MRQNAALYDNGLNKIMHDLLPELGISKQLFHHVGFPLLFGNP